MSVLADLLAQSSAIALLTGACIFMAIRRDLLEENTLISEEAKSEQRELLLLLILLLPGCLIGLCYFREIDLLF